MFSYVPNLTNEAFYDELMARLKNWSDIGNSPNKKVKETSSVKKGEPSESVVIDSLLASALGSPVDVTQTPTTSSTNSTTNPVFQTANEMVRINILIP